LTDDNAGEAPMIPARVQKSCSSTADSSSSSIIITQMVQSLMNIAEFQATKIAANPFNPILSPLLAKTFLWFFGRWAPAYIKPSLIYYDSDEQKDGILVAWQSPKTSQQAVSFIITLCLVYHCHWPQESHVHESSISMLFSLVKRDKDMKSLIIGTPSMEQLATLHIVTATMTHYSKEINGPTAGLSSELITGYRSIPYKYRGAILTVILIGSSEMDGSKSEQIFNGCLDAVQRSFSTLIQALESKTVKPNDMHTQENLCLCVELYCGVAQSSEISNPERIPTFITPSLLHLSNLMTFYAKDLTICEVLLRFFRDYTEQFISILSREQCLAVFKASADLLKHYSTNHCSSRVTRYASKSTEVKLEEEQNYSDISCAIQLLLNLGAKDFIDVFSSTSTTGLTTNEITDVIFFGLSQILKVMTIGLLEFPNLCKQYFSLAGFMMDTYPEKAGSLPYSLFCALLDSLLYGMSHADISVSRYSLEGIAALVRQHIQSSALCEHLATNQNLFSNCTKRLLEEVVFTQIIWDRLEQTAMALLPLAAVEMDNFASIVSNISQQLDTAEKQEKLRDAFQKLMQAEVVTKVSHGGSGGRMNRMRFKKDFEVFVKEIHSTVFVF